MANVVYQFDMFEDASDLKIFQKAPALYCALSDIDGDIRMRMKHEKTSDEEYKFLDRMRELAAVLHELDC